MTERLAHGQCQRCGAYATSPTYKCETCGTNYVELFPTPVSLQGAGASATIQPAQSSNVRPHKVETIGERILSLAVCLAVAGIAAVPAVLLFIAAVIAQYFACGDNSPCGPHLSPRWTPYIVLMALAAASALIVIVNLLLALLQIVLAVKQRWPSGSR